MYCPPWLRMTNAHMTGFFCKFIFCRRHSFYQSRDRVTTECYGRNAFSLIGICFVINFSQSKATAFLNLALKRKPYSRSLRCIYSCTNSSSAHRIFFFGWGSVPFPSPSFPVCATAYVSGGLPIVYNCQKKQKISLNSKFQKFIDVSPVRKLAVTLENVFRKKHVLKI